MESTTSKYSILKAAGVRYSTVKKTSNSVYANTFAVSVTFSEIPIVGGPGDFFVAAVTSLASYS